MSEKLPQRTEQHVIGDRAEAIFKYKRNPRWLLNPSAKDYGWDYIITTSKDGNVNDDFFVQLKGHEAPDYSTDGSYISEPLSVATVNFLLNRTIPVMLCICDISRESLYYTWIADDIKRINAENPDWQNQESVTFRVPISNTIETTEDARNRVENYIANHRRQRINEKVIGEVLSPVLGVNEGELGKFLPDDTLQIIRPTLEKADLVDDLADGMTGLSPNDQELLRKIKETSNYLKRYMHSAAKEVLDSIQDKIDTAVASVRSKYHNNRGVYYSQHSDDLVSALNEFRIAAQLSTNNYKATYNVIQTEYGLYRNGVGEQNFDEWTHQLDAIIGKYPEYCFAHRMKAYIIADNANAFSAEEHLKSTKAWDLERTEAKVCIAEMYMRENNMVEAERVLGDEPHSERFEYWGITGFVRLALATGISRETREYYVSGMGPSSIDHEKLVSAEVAYKTAFDILLRHGLPSFSDEILVTYTTVLHLLFKHEEGLSICNQFLARHPDNRAVKGAIGSCYLWMGRPDEAVPYSKEVFEANPNKDTLKNYCICLFDADDHDECIKVIREWIGTDIAKEWKGLFLALLAMSLNEIGNVNEATNVLNFMKSDAVFAGEAISTEAVISRKNGASRERSIKIFEDGKSLCPDSIIFLSNYAANLNPDSLNEAAEVKYCFDRLVGLRELFPDEHRMYARALSSLGDIDAALGIIQRASQKYPSDLNINYDFAITLVEAGDEESAYAVLEQGFSRTASYLQVRNFANLAYRTGRYEKARNLLQKALTKATDPKNKGELHCILYELKMAANLPANECLRHMHEFGKTFSPDNEQLEARYLSMFLLARAGGETDEEMGAWVEEAKNRLEVFLKNNPNNLYFKQFTLDKTLTAEEQKRDIRATIMAELLPYRLKAGQLEIAARSNLFPLAFRAAHIGGGSIFEYWSHSLISNDDKDRIHIFHVDNDLNKENDVALSSSEAVIDISALLTLAYLNLLDVLHEFERIIIGRETRVLFQPNTHWLMIPHELTTKLEQWRLDNRDRIRIRGLRMKIGDAVLHDRHYLSDAGIYLENKPNILTLIGEGMGEAVALANQLKIPLYSDDSAMRIMATSEYHVKTFSSLSLLHRCESLGRMGPEIVTTLYSKFISSHFVTIPLNVDRLTNALFIYLSSLEGATPTLVTMLKDNVFGEFLREFGDTKYDLTFLMNTACKWWHNLMRLDVSNDIIQECMQHIGFAISMRSIGTVTQGIVDDEQELRLAGLWFRLIVITQSLEEVLLPRIWSLIKSTTEQLCANDELKYSKIIYTMIPDYLLKLLSDKENAGILYSITSCLPNDPPTFDKQRIETYISKRQTGFRG